MENNFSFNPEFDFDNAEIDDLILNEGVELRINRTVSQSCRQNSSILKEKGEVKSEEREKFKNELGALWVQQSKERSNSKSENPEKISINCQKSSSKLTLKEDIRMMLSQLANRRKNSSNNLADTDNAKTFQRINSTQIHSSNISFKKGELLIFKYIIYYFIYANISTPDSKESKSYFFNKSQIKVTSLEEKTNDNDASLKSNKLLINSARKNMINSNQKKIYIEDLNEDRRLSIVTVHDAKSIVNSN